MSHELEILEDGTASMFSGEGLTPWHGLGTVVDGLVTADEAMKIAHLDWEVEKQEIFLASREQVPDRFAVVRTSDQKPLGIVGCDYRPFQNSEAFSFFDTVTDETGEAHYTAAGALFGGKQVFLTAKIGDDMMVAGDDKHQLYLLLTTSHDGSRAFTAATTMIRSVCNNTVTLGLKQAKTKWSLTHKSTLEGKAQEAREALQLSYKYASAFDKEVERLLQVEMDADKFQSIISGLLPEQKRQKEKNVAELMQIWESEPTVVDTSAAGNGWGAVNTITFWTDHVRKVRSAEARYKLLTDGFAAKLRTDVKNAVLASA